MFVCPLVLCMDVDEENAKLITGSADNKLCVSSIASWVGMLDCLFSLKDYCIYTPSLCRNSQSIYNLIDYFNVKPSLPRDKESIMFSL